MGRPPTPSVGARSGRQDYCERLSYCGKHSLLGSETGQKKRGEKGAGDRGREKRGVQAKKMAGTESKENNTGATKAGWKKKKQKRGSGGGGDNKKRVSTKPK